MGYKISIIAGIICIIMCSVAAVLDINLIIHKQYQGFIPLLISELGIVLNANSACLSWHSWMKLRNNLIEYR